MKIGKVSKKIATAALAALVLGSGSAYAAYNVVVGPQNNGTGVASDGWFLKPAGSQITLGDFPMGSAVSPDHQYQVVTNAGEGTQSLQVVDLKQHKIVQTLSYQSPEALYFGSAFSPDGKTLYVSAGDNNKIRVYQFENGTLTEQAPIRMSGKNFYPAGISVSADGKSLYVANNLDNSVSCIDIASGQISKTTSVGKNPYMAFLSHDQNTLYVSNWGESSVSVLNAKDLSLKNTLPVGLHPNAIAENPITGFIYVTNSDSDEISVVDPTTQHVVQTISLAPYQGAPTGTQPDALTVSPDGQTLYVANAGNNDIAVIDLKIGKVKGLIPTAWYPTGVQVSEDGKQLTILNAKGLGAGPNTQMQNIGSMIQGSLSFIDVPDQNQLEKYTKQVKENNHTKEAKQGGLLSRDSDKDFPIPKSVSGHSPIKHVIYVVKENRTYDQVFGDLGKGNGDPSLTMFGKEITPNLHKLANQFVTFDNFYADAEVSITGHKWITAAKANDYIEKNWLAAYGRSRGYDVYTNNPANYSEEGHIWNNASKAGVSFRVYGEYENYNSKTGLSTPVDPSIGNNYDPNYPAFNFNIQDVDRVKEWEKEFKQFEQKDNLPQLEIMHLGNDHTQGTIIGAPTPQAEVADNDYALGQLVDTVSHSKYWKDTAIFVTEDDAQGGQDHVDAHRTETLVISPYTQTGAVDSTLYDTAAMVKTIEMILGMKPMSQFDAAATPMQNAFSHKPNTDHYTVVEPTYPLDAKNGQNAPMAQVSQKMDFSQPDAAPSDELNKILWKATKGDQPYPEQKKQ
ncbi:bifunctional YncE family protein/alkaline phosphatase family protein [Neobacillus massiliamazoniensis]|uniref:40-residue YVTN family beta-propeller repeat-containing protein n=1 Tax=Neobacillus massiliamazoniensis TaxID=1499688 RepID=A0A0U1NYX2_9BACI|nr:bifunctional YncE family protein/alkaline phosphatase family protein [Neobacillus massiliamazoniensis]CRK83048.1 40-residue YVTN family beta-propeller repeat-containing protein [Neobacillus massiliamazoniensis]